MDVPQPTAFPVMLHDRFTHASWTITRDDADRILTGCGGPFSCDQRMMRVLPESMLVMEIIYQAQWRPAYQYWYEGQAYDFKDLQWASPD